MIRKLTQIPKYSAIYVRATPADFHINCAGVPTSTAISDNLQGQTDRNSIHIPTSRSGDTGQQAPQNVSIHSPSAPAHGGYPTTRTNPLPVAQ